MRNNLKYFLATITVAGLIAGCSKQADKPSIEDQLIGTWQWVRTDGGFAFQIHETPITTGRNIDLKITSEGKYSLYTNGSLTSNGTYTLEKKQCIHDLTDKTFVNFSNDSDFMVETIDNNHLDVSDEAHDGVGSSYKRKSLNGN